MLFPLPAYPSVTRLSQFADHTHKERQRERVRMWAPLLGPFIIEGVKSLMNGDRKETKNPMQLKSVQWILSRVYYDDIVISIRNISTRQTRYDNVESRTEVEAEGSNVVVGGGFSRRIDSNLPEKEQRQLREDKNYTGPWDIPWSATITV